MTSSDDDNARSTRVLVKMTPAKVHAKAVGAVLARLLSVVVVRAHDWAAKKKNQQQADEASGGSQATIVVEFATTDAAERAVDMDNKLGEVFGCAVEIALLHEKKKTKRRREQDDDGTSSDSDTEVAKAKKKRAFVEKPRKKDEDAIFVDKACTVVATRCPGTFANVDVVMREFGRAGAVRNVVLRHDASGSFRRVAFVEYANEESAT
jgi:hypothetical protein